MIIFDVTNNNESSEIPELILKENYSPEKKKLTNNRHKKNKTKYLYLHIIDEQKWAEI